MEYQVQADVYGFDPPHIGNMNISNAVTQTQPANRFIYVNQRMMDERNAASKPTKVLINPNFRPASVHINPNFRGPNKIHVNPNVFRTNESNLVASNQVQNNYKPFHSQAVSYFAKEQNVVVPFGNTNKYNGNINKTLKRDMISKAKEESKELTTKENNVQPKAIVSTRTKLIRVDTQKKPKSPLVPNGNEKYMMQKPKEDRPNKYKYIKKEETKKKRKVSFHSKYKIIRRSISSDGSKKTVHNAFKIDRRVKKLKAKPQSEMKVLSKYKLIKSSGLQNRKALDKVPLIKSYRNTNMKIISINGKLYRRTSNKLRKVAAATNDSNSQKGKVLLIKGQLFKLGGGKVSRTVNGQSCVLSKTKLKRIPSVNTRKSNVPCPYFRKFGKCPGKANGKCIKKHNPDQVALCTKFLQGACVNENCSLSHNISPEKMPTCKFFLEGFCSREKCPYLHVKINAKADICRDFLEGFCEKAAMCEKRHQYLCPEFEKSGKCPKSRCPYPHGSRVRNALHIAVAKKFKVPKEKLKENLLFNPVEENVISKPVQETPTPRYYEKGDTEKLDDANTENQITVIKSEGESVENFKIESNSVSYTQIGSSCTENISECEVDREKPLLKRPKLGTLPSFIPFDGI